jgi:hypothetical protein
MSEFCYWFLLGWGGKIYHYKNVIRDSKRVPLTMICACHKERGCLWAGEGPLSVGYMSTVVVGAVA